MNYQRYSVINLISASLIICISFANKIYDNKNLPAIIQTHILFRHQKLQLPCSPHHSSEY